MKLKMIWLSVVVLCVSVGYGADVGLSRQTLLEKLEPYWGDGPQAEDIVDPQMVILEKTELDDHYRWHIRYKVEKDDVSYAYILLPKPMPTADNPRPLVLCPHPTNGLGKKSVCGVYDAPPRDAAETHHRRQRQYALDLVRVGFIAFAPDMAGYGERVFIDLPTSRYNFEHVEDFKQRWLKKWPGAKFPHAKQRWDMLRTVDLVMTLDFVDTDNIGIIGHSLGAWTTMYTMPYDTRIKAGVANAAGGLQFMRSLWEDEQALRRFLANPSIQNLHNTMNVWIMATAPRAMLYIKPYNDYVAYERAWDNHLEAFKTITAYYNKVADGGDNYKAPFDVYYHNRGHTFEDDSRALAYGWLYKQLMGETAAFPLLK